MKAELEIRTVNMPVAKLVPYARNPRGNDTVIDGG